MSISLFQWLSHYLCLPVIRYLEAPALAHGICYTLTQCMLSATSTSFTEWFVLLAECGVKNTLNPYWMLVQCGFTGININFNNRSSLLAKCEMKRMGV